LKPENLELFIILLPETNETPYVSKNATDGAENALRALKAGNILARFWAFPEFLVPLAQPIGPTLGVVIVAWIQSRPGRKARLRVGDIEVEARTEEDVDELLERALCLQQTVSKQRANY